MLRIPHLKFASRSSFGTNLNYMEIVWDSIKPNLVLSSWQNVSADPHSLISCPDDLKGRVGQIFWPGTGKCQYKLIRLIWFTYHLFCFVYNRHTEYRLLTTLFLFYCCSMIWNTHFNLNSSSWSTIIQHKKYIQNYTRLCQDSEKCIWWWKPNIYFWCSVHFVYSFGL